MSTFLRIGFFVAVIAVIQSTAACAQDIPHTISYQGTIQSPTGIPIADGEYLVILHLYADPDGKEEIWSAGYNTPVANGIFNLTLGGGGAPLPTAAEMSRPLWIGTQIGDAPVMRPLAPLGSSPYALAIADRSVSANKMATDYVSAITVNGQRLSGVGTDVHFVSGPGLSFELDPSSNTVLLSSESSVTSKGANAQHEGFDNISPMTALGDMIYGSTPIDNGHATGARLAGNTSSTKKFLTQTGTGSASAAPAWGTISASDISGLTVPVTSVFGRTGDVVAQSGDYGSDQVTEGSTNRYYTDARARAAISAMAPLSYNSVNGVMSLGNIPETQVTNLASDLGNKWSTTGNAGTAAGTNFIGTTDSEAFEIRVYNNWRSSNTNYLRGGRAMRFEPHQFGVNIIGGDSANSVRSGVSGATIAGGGGITVYATGLYPNRVQDNSGTVGGGAGNVSGDTGLTAGFAVVAGGRDNWAKGSWSAVLGGDHNRALSDEATVTGGAGDTALGFLSAVVGGTVNIAGGSASFVGGGSNNRATGYYTSITGGRSNMATADYSNVNGGNSNLDSASNSVIAGGSNNIIYGGPNTDGSAIAGGIQNWIFHNNSFIGSGYQNRIYGPSSVIAGGFNNTTGYPQGYGSSFIGGGSNNSAPRYYSTIVGGAYNSCNDWDFIGGGLANNGNGSYSVIVGGDSNNYGVFGNYTNSFIGGGHRNYAGNYAVDAGGAYNSASGDYSAVGGGRNNVSYNKYSAIPGGQNLGIGFNSFGFNGDTSATRYTNFQYGQSMAYFGNVDLWIGNVDGQARMLKFYAPNTSTTFSGAYSTSFKAAAQSSDVSYTLPAADGSSGQALTTNGSGVLSWVSHMKNWVSVPASSTASGQPGDAAYDANYLYICVAANTWERTPLSSW
ncbi:MAG: hypothetical protein Q8922_01850 [Bacteroidota bacterium]|nr:hypothetical protein [Bacteroidota bacterium]MDP4232029.1 hypothetical protein [Bacteroidota bacterium]MDP4241264.1 hypothetical protein [Bacteroidota bacterium]MDP4286656.1 hypothetical protein [Bacteroidota bacterium]